MEGEKVENVDKSFNDGTEDEESKILKDSGGDEIFGKDEEDDDTVDKRGTKYRQYIKEKLVAHPLWHDGNYWEQALWQCAIEQVLLLQ